MPDPPSALRKNSPGTGQVTLALTSPHRRGKVGRFPKLLRDQINQMIRDGCSYSHILQKLKFTPETAGLCISKQNLSRWKLGGYQEWLAQQEWREDMRERQADALELLHDSESSKFQEVSLQVAAMRIFQLLQRLEASSLPTNLHYLHPGFIRLLAVLPRISREALRYQKYRDACVRARIQLQALQDPKRKLNDDERRAIVRNVDEILGLASPDPESPSVPAPSHDTHPVTAR